MPVMSGIEGFFCRTAPWRSFAHRVILPWALQGFTPYGDVLELGSGSGAMADATARAYPDLRLTVTDIDPAMVAMARRTLAGRPHVTVSEADVTSLPYDDGSFDVVASYLMLHHVVEWRPALREAARVLRPGGTLIGYDLQKTWLADAVHVVDRSPYRLIGRDELAHALDDEGFEAVQVAEGLGHQVLTFRGRKAE